MNEDNSLIAEFMGWKIRSFPMHMKSPLHGNKWWFYHTTPTSGQPACLIGEEHFHDSWEWLMPVVEKILLGKFPLEQKVGVQMALVGVEGLYQEGDRIEQTHRKVVEFIKWYNANRKEHGSTRE